MLKLDSNLNRIYGYLIYPYYYAEGETLYNVRQRIGINIRVSKIIYLNIEIRLLYTLTLSLNLTLAREHSCMYVSSHYLGCA